MGVYARNLFPTSGQDGPLTLEQMLEKRTKYSRKIQNLKAKIQLLPEGKNKSYVTFKSARMKAGMLANDFMFQTLERPATI